MLVTKCPNCSEEIQLGVQFDEKPFVCEGCGTVLKLEKKEVPLDVKEVNYKDVKKEMAHCLDVDESVDQLIESVGVRRP